MAKYNAQTTQMGETPALLTTPSGGDMPLLERLRLLSDQAGWLEGSLGELEVLVTGRSDGGEAAPQDNSLTGVVSALEVKVKRALSCIGRLVAEVGGNNEIPETK
jgi:hypothetical protein